MSGTEQDHNVLLVGAGPAGISAAIWLQDYGVPFLWIDRSRAVGGLLHRVHNCIQNYPGGVFDNGGTLAEHLNEHLLRLDLQPTGGELVAIEREDEGLVATLDGTRIVRPELLLLTTGTRYRTLGVPGEKEGLGKWVSQSAMADADRFAGQSVAMVGGGDSAFEGAKVLAQAQCSVTMLIRSPELRARPEFVKTVQEDPRITIAPIPSVVERIAPTSSGCRLEIDQQGHRHTLEVAALFVRIGVEPALPSGCEELACDARGFLCVDHAMTTSAPDILAAGDLRSTDLRSVAVSVGDGAQAAQSCAALLGFL